MLLLLSDSRLYVLLSGLTFRMRLLCLVLPLLLSIESAAADSKAITTTLTTKWANTPLLLEARYVTSPLYPSLNLRNKHLELHVVPPSPSVSSWQKRAKKSSGTLWRPIRTSKGSMTVFWNASAVMRLYFHFLPLCCLRLNLWCERELFSSIRSVSVFLQPAKACWNRAANCNAAPFTTAPDAF